MKKISSALPGLERQPLPVGHNSIRISIPPGWSGCGESNPIPTPHP
ncbi:hypothetical protein N6H13_25930 [Paenibacillus sp. CC-CFT742]|nr:hypothetical protein [Paenibacillus sp. CC-CFT742]WJH28435.1 hypothetical protein N6H13_25930 [Paenibacillus sp. CC-CFT742]